MLERLAILCTAATFALTAQAGVYKWQDAEGHTHYSSSPPRNSQAQEINVRAGTGTPEAQPPAQTPPPAPTDEGSNAGGQSDADTPRNQDACTKARENVRILESTQPVTIEGQDGKPVLLDDTARARELERARKGVEYFCHP